MKPLQTAVICLVLAALVLAVSDRLVVTVTVGLLVFAGIIFGVFFQNLANIISKKTQLGYRISYLILMVMMFSLIAGGSWYTGSQAVDRTHELWSELRSAYEQKSEQLKKYQWAKEYLPDSEQMQQVLTDKGTTILPPVFKGLQAIGWGLTSALVIIFVGLYAAFDPQLYRQGLLSLIPESRRKRIGEVLDQVGESLVRWTLGRIMSMALVGVATAIGLSLLGVQQAIALGVLSALLTFIPNIGPLLAAIPQTLLALSVGTETAIYVVALNIVLQGVESYLITPMIQRHEVELPPILTIAMQLLMGTLVGVIGVMMAAPLVVVSIVLVQTLYIQDYLGNGDTESEGC